MSYHVTYVFVCQSNCFLDSLVGRRSFNIY